MKRTITRERIGTNLAGLGFITLLIFASAIDGPGNDMRVVYAGIAASMTLLGIGASMAGMWG